MPIEVKQKSISFLRAAVEALGARGKHYVMMEPVWDMEHGPLVTLNLARAAETGFNDTIFDRREIEVSEGGWGYLGSKYGGGLGKLETFDNLKTARTRYDELVKEAMAYRRTKQAES